MKLSVCAQALYHLPLHEALATAKAIGFEAIELPVHRGNPFVDLDGALAGGWRDLAAAVREHGLEISAFSVHQEGQLLLGPHGVETDGVMRGEPEEKAAFAARRMIQAARLAALLEVDVVCGFTGCAAWPRFFPWPMPDGYAEMAPSFRARLLPVLDVYAELGVRFAHECHPNQFAYNLETALWSVEILEGHPAWAFNFDPANLLLAGMAPAHFVRELGDRIVHVHAKDGERVAHNIGRSGLLAHGDWRRPDRGFRFRVPGWGELSWRGLITELQIAGYRGALAVEHEDPTMSRLEGLRQGAAHLRPILLREPPEDPWW